MSELAGDDRVYCLKRLKQKLQERYGNKLYFAEIKGKSNVCFQNDRLLPKRFVERKKTKDKEKGTERIVMTAAKVIIAEIRDKYDTSTYPKTTDIHNTTRDWIIKLLKTFLQVLFTSDLRQNSIDQAIVQAVKPRSTIMPGALWLSS